MTHVNVAAEGACDIRAVERLAGRYGIVVGTRYDCRGKSKLDNRLLGFLSAAIHAPWIIVRDLDEDASCAPGFIAARGIQAPNLACFRLAVRSIEAWLFADPDGLSSWLGVKRSQIPAAPDSVTSPKMTLVQLASQSKNRSIKARLVARPEDGSIVGPEYGAALYEFIDNHWDVSAAVGSGLSPSLTKAAHRIEQLKDRLDAAV